jgi:hypothetical protein
VHGLVPIDDVAERLVRHHISFFPFKEIFFKPVIRRRGPLVNKFLPLFHGPQGILGKRTFNLGDAHLFPGGNHQKIGRIYLA